MSAEKAGVFLPGYETAGHLLEQLSLSGRGRGEQNQEARGRREELDSGRAGRLWNGLNQGMGNGMLPDQEEH